MTLFLVLRLEMISLGFSKLGKKTRNTLEGEIKVVENQLASALHESQNQKKKNYC